MDAHKVFDARSTQHEVTMSSIIHVSVSHVVYPVTEAVLRQVFSLYDCSVKSLALFQGNGWVEASIQLMSGHEAVRARDALHGCNIYDGCCNISIKCTPTPRPSHASNLLEAPALTMASTATITTAVVAPTPVVGGIQSMPIAAVMDMADATPVVGDAAVVARRCQEKVQLQRALKGFDATSEVSESKKKPSRIISWVSGVPIPRRPVRWTPRRKYHHSSLSPPPPRPPDQPCSVQVPAPKSPLWPSFQFVISLKCSRGLMLAATQPWCQNAFSPRYKELHMMHLFSEARQRNCQTVSIGKLSTGIWYPAIRKFLPLTVAFDIDLASCVNLYMQARVQMFLADNKFFMPEKYKGLNFRWDLKWPTHNWWASRSSSMHDAWLTIWAPTQCSSNVVRPLFYFSIERQGFMIKEGGCLSVASKKHPIQQLSCYVILICVGDFDSTTINGTQFFAAYHEWSWDLRVHEICLFLAISDATILCQEFLQWHTSVASLLSMTSASVRAHASMDLFEISGEDSELILDHEQNTHVLAVLPEFLLHLQRPQGLDLLTLHELHNVYMIAIMPVAPCVEVLDAHLQWDPGGFLSTMNGEQEPDRTEQSWRMQRICARGYRLIIGLDDLSTPWDPGIVSIYALAVPVRVKTRRPQYRSVGYTLL